MTAGPPGSRVSSDRTFILFAEIVDLGEIRSNGKQSQAGKSNMRISGAKKASDDFMASARLSFRAMKIPVTARLRIMVASTNASNPSGQPENLGPVHLRD